MPEEKEETARVTMLWPVDLKEAVREEVGSRGLTEFAIAAVKAKLGTHDAHKEDSKELNEVKFLAQQLADHIALAGSDEYADPRAAFEEIGLPDWMDTTGWPERLADVVKAEDSIPEPVVEPTSSEVQAEPDPEDDEDLHRPMALTKPKGVGDTILKESPVKQTAGDLLERVRAKALEKGVDLTDARLKPASEIVQGPHQSQAANSYATHGFKISDMPKAPQLPTEPTPKLELPAEPATDVASANTCPKCRAELVLGECWAC